MLRFTLVALTAAVAFADDIFPKSGDFGTIAPCAEGTDNCEFCVKEEEEAEEEADASTVAVCLDKCAKNGYYIEQLNDTSVVNDNGETIEYWQIKMTPTMLCPDGCGCPTAYGLAEKAAVNDEGGIENPEEYELVFEDIDGSADAGLGEGKITISYEEGVINQVAFAITYYATITNNNGEEKVEKEKCNQYFSVATGTVAGYNMGDAPAKPKFPVGDSIGSVTRYADVSDACSTFDEGSADWCTFTCSKEYSVGTHDNAVTFVPQSGYISEVCKCPWGQGYQIGSGAAFEQAQISFEYQDDGICSHDFGGKYAVAWGNATKFTVTHTMSDDSECTYRYEIKGKVMGIEGSTSGNEHDAQTADKGQVAFALILTALVIIGFCAPSFMK